MDRAIIVELKKPMPEFEKPGPGKVKYKYIKGEDVVERLNAVFGHEWSSEVKETRREDDYVIVHLRLTVPAGRAENLSATVYKEAFGGAPVMKKSDGKPVDMGNSYKSALTNALKKAAEQLGIGLKQEEGEDNSTPVHAPVVSSYVPRATVGSVGTAESSVKLAVRSPPVEVHTVADAPISGPMSNEMMRAEAMLRGVPEEKLPEKGPREEVISGPTTPSVERVAAKAFPTSGSRGDMLTPVQEGAIKKLCSAVGKAFTEVVQEGTTSGEIDKSLLNKELKALTKMEASSVIRHLSSKTKERTL